MKKSKHDLATEVSGGGPHGNHPNHKKEMHRVSRIKGQIDGVARMLEEQRYCPDIITQIEAIRAALAALQSTLLERHLSECVRGAFTSTKSADREKKIEELLEIFRRR